MKYTFSGDMKKGHIASVSGGVKVLIQKCIYNTHLSCYGLYAANGGLAFGDRLDPSGTAHCRSSLNVVSL